MNGPHFRVRTRRVVMAEAGRPVPRWVAWLPGLGFSAEGDTEAEAVGELLLTLAEFPDVEDLDEAELVRAEGGAA